MPTVLITGGHGGIGFECAKELAIRFRCDLILAGRSPDRMTQAAQELERLGGIKVTQLPLDISSLCSVREAAAELRRRLDSHEVDGLQALVCNAGTRFFDLRYSSDGYELTFATNYLGHFLLVELLADRVAPDARIVFTVSGTHDPDTTDGKLVGKSVRPDARSLANVGKNGEKPITSGQCYSTSKLCMVMHAYELDRRLRIAGSSVESVAFCPGSVPDSGFLRSLPAPARWLASSPFGKWLAKKTGTTTGDLKFSGVALARVALDRTMQSPGGKYFQVNDFTLTELRSSKLSYDSVLARTLWDESKRLVKLQPSEEPALLR